MSLSLHHLPEAPIAFNASHHLLFYTYSHGHSAKVFKRQGWKHKIMTLQSMLQNHYLINAVIFKILLVH